MRYGDVVVGFLDVGDGERGGENGARDGIGQEFVADDGSGVAGDWSKRAKIDAHKAILITKDVKRRRSWTKLTRPKRSAVMSPYGDIVLDLSRVRRS